nr:MAG TPA: hypothetical protein [Caudoviricetes sp.]
MSAHKLNKKQNVCDFILDKLIDKGYNGKQRKSGCSVYAQRIWNKNFQYLHPG